MGRRELGCRFQGMASLLNRSPDACRSQWRDRPRPTEVPTLSHGFKSRLALALVTATLIASLSAGAALAGEITGNDRSLKIENSKWGTGLHARSFCAFSGQNDIPDSTDPHNPPGRVQSYGFSFARNGLKALVPSPSVGCNPTAEFEG
jgi:hypothetical protein